MTHIVGSLSDMVTESEKNSNDKQTPLVRRCRINC